jgi:hypothetical protein
MPLKWDIHLLATIAVGLAVRLALAPFTGHPYDLLIWMKTGEQVAGGGSPYDLTFHVGYPDLWALWTAISYILASALGGNKFFYILTIKLPIILGDFVVVCILVRLIDRRPGPLRTGESTRLRRKIVASYLLNPYVIVVGAVWGMMDNLAAALMVLFFLLANNRKLTAGVLAYCLSILLKLYPIIFLPLALLHINKSYRPNLVTWMKTLGVSLATLAGVGLLPFYLFGWNIWIFLYSTYHQLFRDPGGIGPLGILSSIHILNPDLAGPNVTVSWWFTLLRFAWLVSLGAAIALLARRGWRTDLAWVFGRMIMISLVWCISFVWVSEQNLLIPLTFILAQAAVVEDPDWRRSYWIGTLIPLAFVAFNVPIWSFAFPLIAIEVKSELWWQVVRPISLILLSIAFTFYAAWEIRRTRRFVIGAAICQ